MSKKVAIVQSSYIPWKGFFDFINLVDEFVLYDDVQFTRRDWRNRNKIKTPNGFLWLTIPVVVKGKYFQKISETTISDPSWNVKHWKSIVHNYAKAKYFRDYKDYFEDLFLGAKEQSLSLTNHRFITSICHLLGISTKIIWSMDYTLVDGKTERLINLCQQAGATEYISGPSAQAYLQDDLFNEAGVNLSYMDYSNYPEYSQLFPPFVHEVSILDLIFNQGPNVIKYMKSFESGVLNEPADEFVVSA